MQKVIKFHNFFYCSANFKQFFHFKFLLFFPHVIFMLQSCFGKKLFFFSITIFLTHTQFLIVAWLDPVCTFFRTLSDSVLRSSAESSVSSLSPSAGDQTHRQSVSLGTDTHAHEYHHKMLSCTLPRSHANVETHPPLLFEMFIW